MLREVRVGAVVGAVCGLLVGFFEVAIALAGAITEGLAAASSLAVFSVALVAVAALLGAVVVVLLVASLRLAVRVLATGADQPGAVLFGDSPADSSTIRADQIHCAAVSMAITVAGISVLVALLAQRFREPGLIAIVAGLLSLPVLFAAVIGGTSCSRAVRARRLLAPARASSDPLQSPRMAILMWLVLGWLGIGAGLLLWPLFGFVFPLRLAGSASLFALLLLIAGRWVPRLCRPSGALKRVPAIGLVIFAVVSIATAALVQSGTARRIVAQSPPLDGLLSVARFVTDVDRDGYGSLFGEGDCAAFDASVHPGAVDIPGDGIDQNCSGADFVPGTRPSSYPAEVIPPELRRDRDVLLVTIDALRYDHVGFAGYTGNTTPNLDSLAVRGVWFDRFYSTGALTKHVLPTLVASRPLEEIPLGERILDAAASRPRRLLPEAVTLAEVFAAAGYRTAMFSSVGWFPDWNISQGAEHVETIPDSAETAPELTRRAQAWIDSQPAGQRWFAWVHYYEPHLPYDVHTSTPSFGDSEAQRYDGESRFVDEEIGRWNAWLDDSTNRRRDTLLAVTSDHGEQLQEFGSFGHGTGLQDYLIHVPLVLVVEGLTPHRVPGLASMIDIAPTLTAFAGVDPDKWWTGRALVSEIVSGRGPDRVVFAAQHHWRLYAAVTTGFKLVRDEYRNFDQLIDLSRDARETDDVSSDQAQVFSHLREALDDWRERCLGVEISR